MATAAPIETTASLDLASVSPIYVLASQVTSEELREAEEDLIANKAYLTYDVREAGIVLTKVSTARRVKLELKWLGLDLHDDTTFDGPSSYQGHKRKRRKSQSVSSTASSDNEPKRSNASCLSRTVLSPAAESRKSESLIQLEQDIHAPSDGLVVARLAWLSDSLKSGKMLSLASFVVLQGRKRRIEVPGPSHSPVKTEQHHASHLPHCTSIGSLQGPSNLPNTVLEPRRRNRTGGRQDFAKKGRIREALRRDFDGRSFSSSTQSVVPKSLQSGVALPIPLVHRTTSEAEEADTKALPELPDWVVKKQLYSCERATPASQPNQDFIAQLDKIRTARLLTSDEIGVRAYSTSIAAIAAYPYELQSSKEIMILPGCDHKIARLFHEYQTKQGQIAAVAELEADQALSTLREFYDIWGVGAITARELYYDRGWRDLDDVIEYGWDTLSRVQQIGLKFYDEFKLKIPRSESEFIAQKILSHARRATDPGVQAIIVGGYRRGKAESGDVDVILSHPNLDITLDLVSQVVASLEKEGWITHTLTLNLTNSKRNQEPLQIRPSGGHGFDTLDKALVVWQDPSWMTRESDMAANPKTKNPNPHRRVDIIISPWKTVGCAVAGWSSGTTFQRDLRRYAKNVKGWKFDSSGVRDRATGAWIDLEGWRDENTRSRDWKQCELRVFEGLGLTYREPEERCTW